MIPVTRSWKELGFRDVPETRREFAKGIDLFEKLSDGDKEKILGKAAFQAYKAGAVSLQDFVGRKRSQQWGTMRYARSLRDILGEKEARKWVTEAIKAQRMQDEPNKLIREWLNPKRVPTEAEIKRVLDHVGKAPFASREIEVDKSIQGSIFLGKKLRAKESSIVAHLAKRVLSEQQWAAGTMPEEYLADLKSIVGQTGVQMAVYQGHDKRLYLGLLGKNNLLPERLGPKAEAFLWVLYAADYGTIVSGYQVSGVEAITLPLKVRWL